MDRVIDRAPVIVFSVLFVALLLWRGMTLRRALSCLGMLWAMLLALVIF